MSTPAREFAWRFSEHHPLLYRGEHTFRMEPIDAHRTRCIDSETFDGILVPMRRRRLNSTTRTGMVAMGAALNTMSRTAHRNESERQRYWSSRRWRDRQISAPRPQPTTPPTPPVQCGERTALDADTYSTAGAGCRETRSWNAESWVGATSSRTGASPRGNGGGVDELRHHPCA